MTASAARVPVVLQAASDGPSAERVASRVGLRRFPADGVDPAVETAIGVTGQDFLFTVPDLAEAIAWARAGALRDDLEGTGALVIGAARTLAEARAIAGAVPSGA